MTKGSPKKKKSPQGQKKLMIALIAVIAVLVVAIGVFLFIYSRDDGLIFSNVYAMDVNLGGMTQQQAQAAIEERAEEVYSQSLTVKLQDRSLVLTPEATGAKLDAAALAEAAFNYGREGNMFQRAKARSAAELTTHAMDAGEFVHLNESYVQDTVNELGAEIFSELAQPNVTVEGERPDISKYMLPDEKKRNDDDEDDEDDDDDEDIQEDAPEGMTIIDPDQPFYVEGGQKITILKGVPGRKLDTQALLEKIHDAYAFGDFTTISMTYEVVEPEPLVLEDVFKEYCVAPVDAVLDENTYVASKETLGYGFDLTQMQTLLDEAEEGSEITQEFQLLVPENTKMGLEADLFSDTLAAVDTKHTWNNNRTTNLILACEAINGYILKPGETFSFNDVVGERTAAKGYKEGTVFSSGNSVPEIGGGVCQVASTLYYGALLADFEIVERAVHSFTVDYVPMGMDATIYWGSLDFKFKNNTEYPVKILMSVHDGSVWLEYLGTDTKDYYVEMEWEQTGKTAWERVDVPYTEANRKKYPDHGVGDTIVTPYTGYKGYTYKCKYDKETNELISREQEAFSSYAKRDKKVFVAVEPEPTQPKPTEPKPTEPKPTEPKPTEPVPTDPPAPTESEPDDDD